MIFSFFKFLGPSTSTANVRSKSKSRSNKPSQIPRTSALEQALCEKVSKKAKDAMNEQVRSCVEETSFSKEALEYWKSEVLPASAIQQAVLNYWKTRKSEYPMLFKVVPVIFAIPGTQVSVERLFSEMRFIVNDYRASLSKDSIDDIMIVRRNFELLFPN